MIGLGLTALAPALLRPGQAMAASTANDITRDSVAEQFGITPNHLSRLFQQRGQMTFSSYLTHVRIDRAKHLLRNYNLKLADIAARCGYNDTPYFCHVFKIITKSTPAGFRMKEHRPSAP